MNKTTRKIMSTLHLWLGLPSGIVVFVVCITGAMYAFKQEIIDVTQPWRFIPPQTESVLLPSQLLDIATGEIGADMAPGALTYGQAHDAVMVDYYSMQQGSATVYINQYSGEVIKTSSKKADDVDFFPFILKGHRSLWLPGAIGKPIVGYSVLLFAITLITGLMLWWPKKWNRNTWKRNLTLKKKRLNFDLHNVFGWSAALFLLILSFTGLIWALPWFGTSVYHLTSGGKELKPYILPKSDTIVTTGGTYILDQLYTSLRKQHPAAPTLYFALPQQADDVIRVSIVHQRGSFYKTDNLFFDRYTLKPLKGQGPYAGKYTEVSAADKLRRMNLEIHDGRILGVPGKILVFLVSLMGASLPVTGMIIWWMKRKAGRRHK